MESNQFRRHESVLKSVRGALIDKHVTFEHQSNLQAELSKIALALTHSRLCRDRLLWVSGGNYRPGAANVAFRPEAVGNGTRGCRYFPSRLMNANAPAVRPTIIPTSKIFLTPVLNTSGGMMSKTNSVANPATKRIAMDAVNLIIPDIESPSYRTSALGQ